MTTAPGLCPKCARGSQTYVAPGWTSCPACNTTYDHHNHRAFDRMGREVCARDGTLPEPAA